MTPLLLGLALSVAAPALKDPPSKGPAVVGRWEATQVEIGGKDTGQHRGLEYEFNLAGAWIIYRDNKPLDGPRSYTTDPKATPAAMDLTENNSTYPGIFKVDGDTLTLVFRTSGGAVRPMAFEAPNDGLMKVVMKRVKADD